jgi:hypothetical protein
MLGGQMPPHACHRCGATPAISAPRSRLCFWGVRVDAQTGARCRECGIADARSSSNHSIWMWVLSGLVVGTIGAAAIAVAARLPIVGGLGALPLVAVIAILGFQRLFSLSRMVIALSENLGAQRRFRKLPAPQGGVAPPARPGRPTFLRSGAAVLLLVVLPASTIAWWGRSVFSRAGTWEAGGCVVIHGHRAAPADCSWRHDGRILEMVSAPSDCPVRTDRIFVVPKADGEFACVDDGRPPPSAV